MLTAAGRRNAVYRPASMPRARSEQADYLDSFYGRIYCKAVLVEAEKSPASLFRSGAKPCRLTKSWEVPREGATIISLRHYRLVTYPTTRIIGRDLVK
jgi:hypothetical protein